MSDNNGTISSISPEENDETPDFTVDDIAKLKSTFLSLEKVVDEISLVSGSDTRSGAHIFLLLEKADVSHYF